MNAVLKFRLPILVVIAVSQIFSPVFVVPGAAGFGASVFRLVLTLTGVALILTTGFRGVSPWIRRALLAGTLLFAWMLLSIGWTNDVVGGVKQLSYVATTLLLIYVLEILVRTVSDFSFLAKTISVFGGCIVAFAFYELQTGNHFHSSLLEIAASDPSMSYITADMAWFTFGNPNDLAVHLIFCSFVCLLFLNGPNLSSLSTAVFLGFSIYLAHRLDARFALVALLAFTAIYFTTLRASWTNGGALPASVALLVSGIVLALGLRLADQAEAIDLSIFIRLQLIANAIAMSEQTLFIGVGTGAFESELSLRGLTSMTYGIVNPHNAFGRIFAENGIIGLFLFGYLILGPIGVIIRAGRTTRLSAFVAGSTIGLFLLLMIGSDPLSASSLQFAIAFVWVAARLTMDLATRPAAALHPHDEAQMVRSLQR